MLAPAHPLLCEPRRSVVGAGSMAGSAARKASHVRVRPRHVRPGYMRVGVAVPKVLWEAVRVEARRQHRTPSACVIVALERALGWDEDEGGP